MIQQFRHTLKILGMGALLMLNPLSNATAAALADTTPGSRYHVYVGTYTTSTSRGLYRFGLDVCTGSTTPLELAVETKNPSFLAVDSPARRLFAVSEVSDFAGKPMGGVSSFAIHKSTGALQLINTQPSGGAGPCHVSVAPDGGLVAVANYGSGSIAVLPVDEAGRLSPPSSVIQHVGSSVNPERQKGPHAHSANFDPAGRWLLAADLGIDRVLTYSIAPGKTLSKSGETATTPGSGPRSLSWHPNGRFTYLVNEMANTITVLSNDAANGDTTETQTVNTLPANWTGKSFGAEVKVHPNGQWVFASNRGHDSIATFEVDPATGHLSPLVHVPVGGKFPRHFSIDPTGTWLAVANQHSDNVVLFRIQPDNGELHQEAVIDGLNQPACVVFVPTLQ